MGAMLHEHGLGRDLIRAMVEASEAAASGNREAGMRWADAAGNYAALLRSHIAKENDVLFVMAERLLSEAEQASLLEAFDRVEINKLGEGTHERLHALMEKLSTEVFPAG